ncbi:MAG TPA: hypothetical protein VMZ04_03760 [Anaerolineae bacterium]|nr:hypothetical protein [Anaerolineae bacterium]
MAFVDTEPADMVEFSQVHIMEFVDALLAVMEDVLFPGIVMP